MEVATATADDQLGGEIPSVLRRRGIMIQVADNVRPRDRSRRGTELGDGEEAGTGYKLLGGVIPHLPARDKGEVGGVESCNGENPHS
jgi:hypothetical protein